VIQAIGCQYSAQEKIKNENKKYKGMKMQCEDQTGKISHFCFLHQKVEDRCKQWKKYKKQFRKIVAEKAIPEYLISRVIGLQGRSRNTPTEYEKKNQTDENIHAQRRNIPHPTTNNIFFCKPAGVEKQRFQAPQYFGIKRKIVAQK